MDVDRFITDLPGCYEDFPRSERPSGRRFDDVVGSVTNLSSENNLALLNLAASLLDEGESYVEVGSYFGASMIGAMRGNEGRSFVAIDRFESADEPFGSRWGQAVTRAQFDANLERFGATAVTVIEGDAFEVLESGDLAGTLVGVLFWDADHSRDGQLRGLRDIEPYLAARALIMCDNADRVEVAAAVDDWLREQPQARLVFEIGGHSRGAPWWHDGVKILAWEATP